MTTIEAIQKRRSVRTFDGTRMDAEKLQAVVSFAEKVENPYDLAITWQVLDVEKQKLRCPVITGTNCFLGGKMARVPHAEEAFGYTLEKVVLYAETIGLGTTWIAGTMDRAAFEEAMGIREGQVMPCVTPLGVPAKKMSLRETLMRKGVKADTRLNFEELFFDSNGKPLSTQQVGEWQLPLDLVRMAPSAVNKQPWRVVMTDSGAHFYKNGKKPDTEWDVQKIDIGIALCHFEIGAGKENFDWE